MASKYSQYSPYSKVKQTWYLDYNLPANILPADTDRDYVIEAKYNEQPWKLSKDLYGTERLYYIFAILNADLLEDPVYDFKSGLTIRLPSLVRVQTWLNGPRKEK